MNIYNLSFLVIFQFLFAHNEPLEFPASSLNAVTEQEPNGKKAAVNVVFKSTDGGQTWQDISEGLPVKDPEAQVTQGDSVYQETTQSLDFFTDDSGLYVRTGNGIYHTKPNSTAPFWKKEIFPDDHSSIAASKNGIFAYSYRDGKILRRTNGTSVWSPVYTTSQEKNVRTVFESADGTVFIGSDRGLFRSTNSGKTWKQVHAGGLVMKLVESKGVLMATSQEGILRSTDGGESWEAVISEGGVGIAIERIKGGFAAINYSSATMTRRVRVSYDGGRTWEPIDGGLAANHAIAAVWTPNGAGLTPSLSIASIIQVGEYFFCGHPKGIFRSSDKGKTWKLMLPSIENKVFNLSVSGNVIYAVPRDEGC